jgi:hypothetical protein
MVLLFATSLPGATQAQGAKFVPGTRTLFSLELAGEEIGEFPRTLKLLRGNMTIVDKDGVRALRASDPGEILISFKEPLPADFTLEFDLVPKICCNPEDLAFEGTPAISRSATSMQVTWQPTHLMAVGGGELFQMDMPRDLAEMLPGQPSQVRASFDGGTFRLYTNARLIYTLNDRKFPRGRVLRISLGGQDDKDHAVYLTRLRVATNSPPPSGQEP